MSGVTDGPVNATSGCSMKGRPFSRARKRRRVHSESALHLTWKSVGMVAGLDSAGTDRGDRFPSIAARRAGIFMGSGPQFPPELTQFVAPSPQFGRISWDSEMPRERVGLTTGSASRSLVRLWARITSTLSTLRPRGNGW